MDLYWRPWRGWADVELGALALGARSGSALAVKVAVNERISQYLGGVSPEAARSEHVDTGLMPVLFGIGQARM